MGKSALIIGATGLIGRSLVFELLKSKEYAKVTVFVRRDMVIKHEKLNQVQLDFDQLKDYKNEMQADEVFCCMGSTRAKTPDLETYRHIDFEIPLETAQITKELGAKKFILVSSMGANKNSSIFYSRLKGELEEAIKEVGFNHFIILRPSLLLGARNESRPMETISQYLMRVLNPLFIGPLLKYKAIPATTVSKAMVAAASNKNNTEKVSLIENNAIFTLAK